MCFCSALGLVAHMLFIASLEWLVLADCGQRIFIGMFVCRVAHVLFIVGL